MMDLKMLLSVMMMVGISMVVARPPTLSNDEIIDYINNLPGNTWKAKANDKFRTIEDLKRMCGLLESEEKLPTRYHTISENEELPESFDPRENWPNCPSLSEIRDQGHCGSCWAFGAASTMTDRICIASNGKEQTHISAEDLLSCCETCGDKCDGGNPIHAWGYYRTNGIVSGGNYKSNQGCRPYSIETCNHDPRHPSHYPNCKGLKVQEPKCEQECRNGFNQTYKADLHYASVTYSVSSEPEQIMKELMKHGPIETGFKVYKDFFEYDSGVYQHVYGKFVGLHAVKLLGWGVEDGTKYWLLANSWNEEWGDNGYFKMLRGNNECGIESHGIAGIPLIKN